MAENCQHTSVTAGGKRVKKRSRPPLSVYLIYLIVLTLAVTGVTFSEYVSSAYGSSTTQVAVMASSTSFTIPNLTGHPGSTRVVGIELTNVENDAVCEVTQSYEVSVRHLMGQIPLEYAFYEDEACTKPATPSGTFQAGDSETRTLWLEIYWPDGTNDSPELSFALNACEIKIIAQQID